MSYDEDIDLTITITFELVFPPETVDRAQNGLFSSVSRDHWKTVYNEAVEAYKASKQSEFNNNVALEIRKNRLWLECWMAYLNTSQNNIMDAVTHGANVARLLDEGNCFVDEAMLELLDHVVARWLVDRNFNNRMSGWALLRKLPRREFTDRAGEVREALYTQPYDVARLCQLVEKDDWLSIPIAVKLAELNKNDPTAEYMMWKRWYDLISKVSGRSISEYRNHSSALTRNYMNRFIIRLSSLSKHYDPQLYMHLQQQFPTRRR